MRRALAATFLLLVVPTCLWAQTPTVDRIDPPFWWVGMEHATVQLMVYGENVADTRVALGHHPGVTLERVTEVGNPHYAFLRLRPAGTADSGPAPVPFRHHRRTNPRA